MTCEPKSLRASSWRHRQFRGPILGLVLAVLLVPALSIVTQGANVASATAPRSAQVGRLAPTGNFTTTSGRSANLDSYFGRRTTLVWFVVAGCATCAVSIPAVAQYLRQLAHDHVHVLVLDLDGDLGSGRRAATNLTEFAKAAAGWAFSNPTWTWGLASKSLSYAYDPSGTPDQYLFVASNRRIAYENVKDPDASRRRSGTT